MHSPMMNDSWGDSVTLHGWNHRKGKKVPLLSFLHFNFDPLATYLAIYLFFNTYFFSLDCIYPDIHIRLQLIVYIILVHFVTASRLFSINKQTN